MSLQLAAQHLANHGRGNDSTLVHMSPREVSSLNALAKSHGGQLTINPHTGLAEAGFLESILPMVAGAGLMAVSGGAINPMTAGLITGGLGFAMTGSLQKGLMAGLGAYGGANLGEGLMASGVDAAAATDTASQAAQAQVAENAANTKFYDPAGGLDPAMKGQYIDAQLAAQKQAMAAREALQPTGFMDKIQMMGKGVGSLGEEGGISNLYKNFGGSPMSLISKVGSAAAPAIGEMMTPKKQDQAPAGDANMGQRYGFSMNPTGGQSQQSQTGQNPPGTPQTTTPFPTPDLYGREQRYFSPSYTKLTPDASKSLYGYAEGGPIDGDPTGMPLNQNDKYPGSYMNQTMYGNNSANPFSQNVVGGSTDAPMNPMTGQGYADGGVADEDRPTETPALQAFKQMQAQRAAQPAQAPIDANAQFNAYAQQSLGAPNQMQAPAATDPTTVPTPNGYGYMYNPVAQKYTQVQGTPSTPDDSSGDPFSIENRPVIGYSSTGEKMYGEKSSGFGGMNRNNIMGMGRAAGGSISDQHMARGGSLHGSLRPPPAFFQNGKYSFHPAQMYAEGGISDAHYNLGGYSDGGRLLRGPGDGVSDSIPATIGHKQPARLADGEFVVPARIVSEIGNGSTEAGARKLYAMMDRVQAARSKTVGKGNVAKNSRADKYLPV